MHEIKCTHPDHTRNSDMPGWYDGTLVISDREIKDGVICSGCAEANRQVSSGPVVDD